MSDSLDHAVAWLNSVDGRVLLILDGGLDLNRPDVGSIRDLRLRYPQLALVIVDWRRDRQAALRAIADGAHGYVPKDLEQEEMLQAFGQVMAGQVYVPPIVGEFEAEALAAGSLASQTAVLPSLTGRQRDVLTHMSMGKSNKEIARSLRISESTVKVHVAAAFRQLGVHNRVGAVALLQSRSAPQSFGRDQLTVQADFGRRKTDQFPPKSAFG